MSMLLASGTSTAGSVAAFLSVVSELATAFFTLMTTAIGWIFDNPAVLVMFAMVIIVAAIGTVRRFLG